MDKTPKNKLDFYRLVITNVGRSTFNFNEDSSNNQVLAFNKIEGSDHSDGLKVCTERALTAPRTKPRRLSAADDRVATQSVQMVV